MTETNPDIPAKEHPADALADMAAGEDEAAEPVEQAEAPSDAAAAMDDAEAGEDEPEVELAIPVARPGPGQARRAQFSASAARARQANAHVYKKTMVPFLAVVAALLMVVAVMTTVLVLRDEPSAPGSRAHLLKILLMVVSYPLSAILAFGAWWFHRETRG